MKNIIYLIIFFPLFCFSQNTFWEIVLLNDQSFINVNLDSLENDNLYVNSNNEIIEIDVDSISYIKVKGSTKSQGGVGFLLGTLAGGLFGNYFAISHNSNSGLLSNFSSGSRINFITIIGALGGALIGAVAGSSQNYSKIYKLCKFDHNAKISIINKLIKKSKKYQNEQLK